MAGLTANVGKDFGRVNRSDQYGKLIRDRICEVRIDPDPSGGVVLRRILTNGQDFQSTRCDDEAQAKAGSAK